MSTAEATMFERMDALEAMFTDIPAAEDSFTEAQEERTIDGSMPVMTSLPCATVTGAVGC
ncbi:hypothetical protein [Corynebacterium belfantii]|uniref:hypothetical protein n=1 Tax=Corynebacterium belfantii TaxID=2014537 RepID=UPI0035A97AD1